MDNRNFIVFLCPFPTAVCPIVGSTVSYAELQDSNQWFDQIEKKKLDCIDNKPTAHYVRHAERTKNRYVPSLFITEIRSAEHMFYYAHDHIRGNEECRLMGPKVSEIQVQSVKRRHWPLSL